ncbi:MAG: hypothetical protein AAF357_15685, partial [Verrucomicrobiota bacterium]
MTIFDRSSLGVFGILSIQMVSAAQPQDEVSYSNDIEPIVTNFCATCHAGDDPEGDLLLTSYRTVREQCETGGLLDRINDHSDPMPEDGLLPPHLRRVFKIWAEKGFLEEGTIKNSKTMEYEAFTAPTITPIDITKEGFDLLESLQGHWVGPMK